MMVSVHRRFVILIHRGHGPTHYDLMLDHGQALATWRLARLPSVGQACEPLPAGKLPDHRRAYLAYEGPVSSGRGRVDRVDAGECELVETHADRWRVRFHGVRLSGSFELRRQRRGGDDWLLVRAGPT